MRCLTGLRERIYSFWLWLTYRWNMWRLGVSEEYIRKAFSALVELDVDEFRSVPGTAIEFFAYGNEVHIKDAFTRSWVIKEGIGHCIYVDEWREETRKVRLEYGSEHETHWHEVYRSGKWIRSSRFVDYLKLLYGNSTNGKL